MKSSIQLWTLASGGIKDFDEQLKIVSENGFSGVEFAGYPEISPEETLKKLNDHGLYSTGAHISIDLFENALIESLEYTKKTQGKFMIIPWAKFETKEDVMKVAQILNNAAKVAKDYGIKVGYHNHAQEFEKFDGKYILDILKENTTEDVVFELDVFWVRAGGADPLEYIKKFDKRVEVVHLKQSDKDGKNVNLEDGIIDMKEVVATAKYAEFFILEQEQYTTDPLLACKANAEYLKNL